jgi:hypothetical protein
MAVTSTPVSASLRFRNSLGVQQTLGSINPELTRANLDAFLIALNDVRRADNPLNGGYFTLREELKQA